MFLVNFRASNKKIVFCLLMFTVIVVLTVAIRLNSFDKQSEIVVECGTEAEVSEYLESFGLQLGECTTDSITVPYEFNEVYTNYNNIQQSQGFDLSEYKGKTVNRYTFAVLNHPDGQDVFVEVLIYNKTVIGADIYSTSVDGFISPLK